MHQSMTVQGSLGMGSDKEHQKISLDECREVVREAISLINALGSLSSGVSSALLAAVAIIIASSALYVSFISLQDIYKPIFLLLLIFLLPLLALVLSITLFRVYPGRAILEAEISKKAIEWLLNNRIEILKRCKNEICFSEASKSLLCLDTEKILLVLNKMSNINRRVGLLPILKNWLSIIIRGIQRR